MRVLGLIPARGGSKGVPGKNIKKLAGKPLIQYTIDAAKSSGLLTSIAVSSDDDGILDLAAELGVKQTIERPEKLATDTASSLDVVIHAVEYLKNKGQEYDAVCLLQPTTPFRAIGFIDKSVKAFSESKADSLVSVLPVPHEYNPHWVFEEDSSGTLRIATGEKEIVRRRQELPPAFIRDGAVYITKTNVLLAKKSLYGSSIAYVTSNPERHINIDTMADWEAAEKLLKNQND